MIKITEIDKSFNKQILDSIPDGLVVVDNNGKWLMTNKPMSEIIGYTEKELLEKSSFDQPFLKSSNIQRLLKEMWERVDAGEIVTDVEAQLTRKDGKKVFLSCSESAIKDKDGKYIGKVLISKDITKIKEKETELKNAIFRFGFVLSKISKGNLDVEVDVDQIVKEYRPIAENINEMIPAIKEREEQLKKTELYFREYSKKVLELAKGWGMGEIFKREMNEWEKTNIINNRQITKTM